MAALPKEIAAAPGTRSPAAPRLSAVPFVRRSAKRKIHALARQLYEHAVLGDRAAAKLVLVYLVGKPAAAVDPDTLDLEELHLYQRSATVPNELLALLTRVPPGPLCTLLQILWPILGQDFARQLCDHLPAAPPPAPVEPSPALTTPVSKPTSEPAAPTQLSPLAAAPLPPAPPPLPRDRKLARRGSRRRRTAVRGVPPPEASRLTVSKPPKRVPTSTPRAPRSSTGNRKAEPHRGPRNPSLLDRMRGTPPQSPRSTSSAISRGDASANGRPQEEEHSIPGVTLGKGRGPSSGVWEQCEGQRGDAASRAPEGRRRGIGLAGGGPLSYTSAADLSCRGCGAVRGGAGNSSRGRETMPLEST